MAKKYYKDKNRHGGNNVTKGGEVMRTRFLIVFVFHLLSVSLVLFPKQFKGPVLMTVNNLIPVTVLDVIAAIFVLAGSVFLYVSLFKFLKSQPKCVEDSDAVSDLPAEQGR